MLPKAPITGGPVVDGTNGLGSEGADTLPALLALGDELRADKGRDVLGDHLLGESEGLGKAVDRGGPPREPVKHGAARGIGKSSKGGIKRLHNHMVVD